MICSWHEASVFPSCIDVRSRCGHADSHWMFNARNPDFSASRSLPKSFTQRPGACEPGENSHRDVTNGRLAGVGFGRPKNRGQYGRRTDRNLDLHLLRYVPILSVLRSVGRLFRGAFVRSVLLFLVPAKYPLPWQGRDFREWQGCVLPLREVALERIKILSHCSVRRISIQVGSNPWLIAHSDSSLMLLNKQAS